MLDPARASVSCASVCMLLLSVVGARAQTTTAISATSTGSTGDGASGLVAISGDARWAVFHSAANDLVAGDTNGVEDVFLRDLATGSLTLVSVSTHGTQGNADSRQAQVSGDGRWVVFQSYSSNLVAGDTNEATDIFVRDVVLGVTTRVSVSSAGAQALDGSRYPCVSRDGRTILFESSAPNLVEGDLNGVKDVFAHDRKTGVTVCATRRASGATGNGPSMSPALSPDGRFAAYSSFASDLVPGDANGEMDVFVHDLALGLTTRVSTTADGGELDEVSAQPSLGADGSCVAFTSRAANLVTGDTNGVGDVFVKDLASGTVVRASVGSTGAQGDWEAYASRVTPDGRFVAFYTQASTIVPGDTNGTIDVFVRDVALGVTERANLTGFGQGSIGHARYPTISDDGRWVAFESQGENLVLADDNGASDVFLRDRAGWFHPHCADDGSHALPCPCANWGGPGRGCENSGASGGAKLVAAGSPLADDVTLTVAGASGLAAHFLQGDAVVATTPFGDGVRCIGGDLLRVYTVLLAGGAVRVPGPSDPSLSERSAELGDPLSSGLARHYQVVYRDPAPFCTGATSNVSNAVRIAW